jgi:two-component system response regulator
MQNNQILLVDDNPDDVYLTIDAFRKTELINEIIVAKDGVEAIDLLLPADGKPGLRPAIVLLDINMPRMGGLEVLSRLRADQRTRALPVIMLTSSAEDRDVLDSYQSGANSYVQKPVTSAEFLAAAKILGIYWLGMNVQASA